MKTSYYNKRKAATRNNAIECQYEVNKLSLSWWDICHMADHFERLGRRYGLLREFRENGII
jgi:hypothetical protein